MTVILILRRSKKSQTKKIKTTKATVMQQQRAPMTMKNKKRVNIMTMKTTQIKMFLITILILSENLKELMMMKDIQMVMTN